MFRCRRIRKHENAKNKKENPIELAKNWLRSKSGSGSGSQVWVGVRVWDWVWAGVWSLDPRPQDTNSQTAKRTRRKTIDLKFH